MQSEDQQLVLAALNNYAIKIMRAQVGTTAKHSAELEIKLDKVENLLRRFYNGDVCLKS